MTETQPPASTSPRWSSITKLVVSLTVVVILGALLSPHDPWLTLADFHGYVDAQHRVALAWHDTANWTRMSILNTAASGFFSTDRTMGEYNRDIWKLSPSQPA